MMLPAISDDLPFIADWDYLPNSLWRARWEAEPAWLRAFGEQPLFGGDGSDESSPRDKLKAWDAKPPNKIPYVIDPFAVILDDARELFDRRFGVEKWVVRHHLPVHQR